MEFEGRVSKLLPVRNYTSKRSGSEMRIMPFVFEYFENPTDRYPDSVVLETFDETVIEHIKEGMEVRCGFSHKAEEYQGKYYNKVRLYKIESVRRAGCGRPAGGAAGTAAIAHAGKPAGTVANTIAGEAAGTAASMPAFMANPPENEDADELPF